MKRAVLALAVTVLAVAAPSRAQDARPQTIPALREWSPSQGTWSLRDGAHVIVRHRERDSLRDDARRLASDLAAAVGHRVATTARRGARARAGDVIVTLSARDHQLGAEGYSLRIGRAFTIAARTRTGLFYGGRTLLQLLRAGAIPRGRARDWPRYAERGLMIDNGRAFFSRPWLEARIRELASLKLNLLHLHFSDNQGFRVESTTHPEVVTPPALSKDDVRTLVEVARRHHVTIVPELDTPGHMEAALRAHPELHLVNAAGQRQPDKLDVTKPEARAFIADLLGEYLPLVPGPWWHTGADEYLGIFSTPADYELYPQLEAYADAKYGPDANGKDAVLDYTNFIGERVRAAGKELRVWSDGTGGGSAVKLDARASVMWWEEMHSPAPQQLVESGHRVLNAGWWPLYYVTGGPLQSLRTPVDQMYESWDAWSFNGPYTRRWFVPTAASPTALAADDPRQAGVSLQVWNDDPASPEATEQAVAAGIAPRLRVLAQKAWASPQLTGAYDEFERIAARVAP